MTGAMSRLAAIILLALCAAAASARCWAEENASVFIDAREVLAAHGARPAHVLVDYRPEQDFARACIPHSLNVSLYSLETLSALKDRRIVLVGTGAGVAEACLRAEALSRDGWRVRVLLGGLPAWKDQGGPLVGDVFAVEECRIVSWGQILADRMFSPVTVAVLDPGHASMPLAEAYAPMTPDPAETPAAFLERLADACQDRPVCLADGNGLYPHRLARMAHDAGLKRYFLIRGGMDALAPPATETALPSAAVESAPPCPSCDLR